MHRIFRTLHLRDLRARMNFKNLREYLAWLYYQYLLITGIYVLEPWEKSIFNSILFSAIAMVVYTSYVFVPIHVRLALEFFLGIFGGQPESTMALMT
ncbi:serine palmitoyltransferase small subunit B isoform X1 [Haplochromis burtoni]|nr:serine palmitoyltransferase small subunit B isoform X1 [Haplochromis burtoni]XP_042080066.1 serine palmitoyltransferase small subunit B isoform X1 [Haplochromis burtoni]